MKKNYVFLVAAFSLIASCKPKEPTPFDKDNKWFAVYGESRMPMISGDSIFLYHLDTNITSKIETLEEYYETLPRAMILKEKFKFSFNDSELMYVTYQPDSATKYDTSKMFYKLVLIDSIPLLELNGKYLVPWDVKKNYGKAQVAAIPDFAPKMELAGYKLGQKIDDVKWVKTGEEVDYSHGCVIGKYKNLLNKDLTANAFEGIIVQLKYDDFTEMEAEELRDLYEFHQKDTMTVDKDESEYMEKYIWGRSEDGTYFSMYKSKAITLYGYTISSSDYTARLYNDNFLDLLAILKAAKTKPH